MRVRAATEEERRLLVMALRLAQCELRGRCAVIAELAERTIGTDETAEVTRLHVEEARTRRMMEQAASLAGELEGDGAVVEIRVRG